MKLISVLFMLILALQTSAVNLGKSIDSLDFWKSNSIVCDTTSKSNRLARYSVSLDKKRNIVNGVHYIQSRVTESGGLSHYVGVGGLYWNVDIDANSYELQVGNGHSGYIELMMDLDTLEGEFDGDKVECRILDRVGITLNSKGAIVRVK